MTARLHVPLPLVEGAELDLPPGATRHVQVLRLQPGSALTLFDGRGGEWSAAVTHMGRNVVRVRLGHHVDASRELSMKITLAFGVPANERMDTLVEKACELGVAALQPLMCERSVLRLNDERAVKKVAHWQAVAVAACEQSGRTVVPQVAPVCRLPDWLSTLSPHASPGPAPARLLLSLHDARPVADMTTEAGCLALSGPEGGLTADEESLALVRGFTAVSLGPRVLRADTAPLALLAHLALGSRRIAEGPP